MALNERTPYLALKCPGLRDPYLAYLRKAILPEIRGEKILGIVDLGDGEYGICANCYAYGDEDVQNRCANHIDETPKAYKKITYLEFRKLAYKPTKALTYIRQGIKNNFVVNTDYS
jgi:hypothetical protein